MQRTCAIHWTRTEATQYAPWHALTVIIMTGIVSDGFSKSDFIKVNIWYITLDTCTLLCWALGRHILYYSHVKRAQGQLICVRTHYNIKYDWNGLFRIGTYYPELTADFSFDDCPEFWQNRKVTVYVMNLKNADYMNNVQVAAYTAIGLDILVGILSLVFNWCSGALKKHYNKSEDKLGPLKIICGFQLGPFQMCHGFGKVKFLVFTIIIGFGMPLTDTVSGVIKFQNHDDRQKFSTVNFFHGHNSRTCYMSHAWFKLT